MAYENDFDILACPSCAKRLIQIDRCNFCGLEFDNDNGVPVLVANNVSRQVSFKFSSHRSSISSDLLRKLLKDPPAAASNEKLPYHFDRRHLQVINRMKKGGRVLEIGCRSGQNRKFFEDKGFKYMGIDYSITPVFDWLEKYGGPNYLCDAHFLPFLDQQFDLVYCAATFEHLACPFQAAQELYRVVKPGGYFLGNVSFLEPWHENSYFHMTPLGVIELLTQANFQIEYIWPGCGYSGCHAITNMGSRMTKALKGLGLVLYWGYRAEHKIKEIIRKKKDEKFMDILNRAKVAGAIDWISYRPPS